MATNFWDCTDCKHRGPADAFVNQQWMSASDFEREGIPYHICPKCCSEDVFPWRKFRCLGCKHEAEQGPFFIFIPHGGFRYGNISSNDPRHGEADLDADPVEEKWEYDCSHYNNRDCASKSYEQIDDGSITPIRVIPELAKEVETTEGQLLLRFDKDR